MLQFKQYDGDDELPSMPFTTPWDIIGQSSTLLLPMAMAVVAQTHLPECRMPWSFLVDKWYGSVPSIRPS